MAKFPQKISLRVLGLISLSLVWLAFPSMAHNGAATLVYPLEGITIDGDLSDWPDDMARYPVAVPFVTLLPADTLDYRASFRIGYDRQALYVAVEAQDESVVLDSVGTPFTQDGCALFLDVEHLEGAYGDSQVEKVYRRLWGDHRRNLHPGDQVEVHREGGRQVYEWRLSLPEDIAETRPVVLGFGLALIDKDEGEPGGIFYWAGYGHNKLGDVMLVDQQTPVGKLKAKVAWRQSGAAGQVYVAVRSQDAPERWVLARSDREGAFELELPAGRYQAVVRLGWEEGAVKEVEIPAGGEVETELTADYPAGRRVEAGPGKKVTAGAGFRQGAWLSFDVVDGLNSPWIKSLYLDREGVLWLGTDGGGVSRYDGQYFTTFAEADSLAANVWAIAQDGNGDMWFGTDRGASRYDGRYFTHFAAADGLLGRQVFAILPGREGNLWFGTDAGVLRYDGKRFERLEPEGEWGAHVRSLFEDRDGALWIGTHSGLFRYGDGKLLHFTSADGLAGNLMGGIAQDPEGALWFSSWERGVSRYQGGEISSFATEEGESPTPANVTCALVDAEGQLWLGSDNGGALRYDGEKFVRFKQQDGLGGDHVSAIAQDPEGHLWFGSEGGLSRYDGGRFRTFTTADGLASDGAERLLEDRAGRLWISTNKGVSRYDGSTFTTLDTSDGLADNRTGAMLEDRSGNLWFATREGVSRYDGERFTTEEGLADNGVRSLLEDRQGHIWFATGKGVSRYDGEHFKTFTAADGLAGDNLWSIAEDREGNLWFSTGGAWEGIDDGEGVSRWDGEQFTTFKRSDGLAGNNICCILADQRGQLWFSSHTGGVSRYDGQGFTTITTTDGLTSNLFVQEDQQGHLWFSSWNGVSRFDGQVFQSLQKRDGLADNDVRSMLQDSRGYIWFATPRGLTRYRPGTTGPPGRHNRRGAGPALRASGGAQRPRDPGLSGL